MGAVRLFGKPQRLWIMRCRAEKFKLIWSWDYCDLRHLKIRDSLLSLAKGRFEICWVVILGWVVLRIAKAPETFSRYLDGFWLTLIR